MPGSGVASDNGLAKANFRGFACSVRMGIEEATYDGGGSLTIVAMGAVLLRPLNV